MHTSEIDVRPALLADAGTIAEFNQRMAHETEQRLLSPEVLAAGVRAVLSDPERGFYFVANQAGRMVGQLMVTREWSDWRNGWFWWIQSVYVAPEFRRRGAYRRLHEFVERTARATPGVCGVRLYVEQENDRAQCVYERLGMQRTRYALYETDWSSGG